MNTITVEFPNSLRKKIEELAHDGGYSIEQFIRLRKALCNAPAEFP